MDGWRPGADAFPDMIGVFVRLGLRGNHQTGRYRYESFPGQPSSLRVARRRLPNEWFPTEVNAVEGLSWSQLLAKSPWNPCTNLFAVSSDEDLDAHVRLNIIPDGGVARFRVYGIVVPDWSKLSLGELVDLAAVENAGAPLACSDMFFSSMNNLIMPGRSENMGDGWETKRRRGPGYDWGLFAEAWVPRRDSKKKSKST